MRDLSQIKRDNARVGVVGAIPPPPPLDIDLTEQEVGTGTVQPQATRVNMLQLTIVHRVGEGNLAITAVAPYIEDPTDPIIVNCRNLLLKEFERISAPAAPGSKSPVWGEFVDAPGEAARADNAVRTPTRAIVLPGQD